MSNHVLHAERLSRATCRVTCHVVRRDSSAVKFDRVLLLFCFFVCLFVVVVLFVFFAFPSYISGVHHFCGEIFAYVTVF